MAALRHVGVVGTGLAGLAAALAAARAGCRVSLFQAAASTAPALHVDVVPNFMRDLVSLGVGAACVRRGFPYQGFAVVDDHGQLQFEAPTPHRAGAPWPAALGIAQADLLAVLHEAVLAHGVVQPTAAPVQDAGAQGAIVTRDGQQHPVDLAVLATEDTGLLVAGQPLHALPVATLPQQWCHALLPRPRGLERATWVLGRHMLRALLVPVGAQALGVALLRPADAPPQAAAEREALAAQGPLLCALAGHWQDDRPVLRQPVRDGILPGTWHQGGVLRIGPSAYQLPLHLGQGAAQELEDARVLGELLQAGLGRAALLDTFMARRGQRARQVHQLAAQAARWQRQPEAGTDLQALAAHLKQLVADPA